MSRGERPIGAAKGKRPNTQALCQPPPPHSSSDPRGDPLPCPPVPVPVCAPGRLSQATPKAAKPPPKGGAKKGGDEKAAAPGGDKEQLKLEEREKEEVLAEVGLQAALNGFTYMVQDIDPVVARSKSLKARILSEYMRALLQAHGCGGADILNERFYNHTPGESNEAAMTGLVQAVRKVVPPRRSRSLWAPGWGGVGQPPVRVEGAAGRARGAGAGMYWNAWQWQEEAAPPSPQTPMISAATYHAIYPVSFHSHSPTHK